MPLNKGGTHRALIVMLRAQQRIAYLDSLSWAPDSDVIGLTQQLLENVEDGPNNWADWIVVLLSNAPRQTDSTPAAFTSAGTPARRRSASPAMLLFYAFASVEYWRPKLC